MVILSTVQRARLPTENLGTMATISDPRNEVGLDVAQLGFDVAFKIDVDRWAIVSASPAARARFGPETLPCAVGDVFAPSSAQRLYEVVRDCLAPAESWVTDLQLGASSPLAQNLRAAIKVETDGENRTTATVLATQSDDAHQSITDLAYRATHDVLTGLPNRSLLFDRLRQSIARTQRSGQVTAVLFLDLDGFKAFNDERGHLAGDQYLQAFSSNAKSRLRPCDTLARIGGDEFIAICEVYGSHDARNIAERIELGVAETDDAFDADLSLSIGIAIIADPNEDLEAAIARADRAMYQAKHSPTSNIVIVERDQEAMDMTTRVPIDAGSASLPADGVVSSRFDVLGGPGSLATSVRRTRLHRFPPSNHDDAVIDLTDHAAPSAFRVSLPFDPRIAPLQASGWGPLQATMDLVSSAGPSPIGISGHVPAIAARDAAHQLIAAAYRVKPGALPFSAQVSAATMAPFLAEMAFQATTAELTPNAIGIEIDAVAVRHLAFSGIEHLRALRQEGVAITVRRLDAASAHDSFLEAAAARVVTIDVAGMSRERLAQLVAIASRANVAVIAEGVDTRQDLATVTRAGCRYAQGDLFAVEDLDRAVASTRSS